VRILGHCSKAMLATNKSVEYGYNCIGGEASQILCREIPLKQDGVQWPVLKVNGESGHQHVPQGG
jgi:hypothetical protein